MRSGMVRRVLSSAGIQAASRALALVMGIILTRTLGPEGYGTYAYAFAIMSLLMVLAEAGVPTLLMREVAAAEGRGEWGLLRGALLRGIQSVALVSGTIAALGFVVLWLMNERIPTASLYTLGMMLLVLPAAALSKTLAHGLRGLNKIVTSQALELILWPALAISITGVSFSLHSDFRTPWIAMAGQFVAVMVVAVFAAFALKRHLPAQTRSAPFEFQTRYWMRSALPFTLISGALVINSQTDVIMLGWMMNKEVVGAYHVAVQISMLIFFPLQVLQSIIAPKFAVLIAQNKLGDIYIIDRRIRYIVFFITAPIFIAIAIFCEQIIIIFFGVDFQIAAVPIFILSAGFLANVACGASGLLLQMAKKEGVVLKVLVFTSALNVVGNLILIPVFGIIGAAASTAFTTFMHQLGLRLLVNRVIGR